MAWEAARRILETVLPERFVVAGRLKKIEEMRSYGLLLRNATRRKIVTHLLSDRNEWHSISALAGEIGENKATVQDHLEILSRNQLLVERRFMNRRLFRIDPLLYTPYNPNAKFLIELSVVGIFAALHWVRQSDLTAGLTIGALLIMLIDALSEK